MDGLTLNDMLMQTQNEQDQRWLLFVYQQMLAEQQYSVAETSSVIDDFLERRELSAAIPEAAQRVLLNHNGV
jgi:hypothetical protein